MWVEFLIYEHLASVQVAAFWPWFVILVEEGEQKDAGE